MNLDRLNLPAEVRQRIAETLARRTPDQVRQDELEDAFARDLFARANALGPLTAHVAALTEAVRAQTGQPSRRVLLSFREAARRLGVCRNKVLPELVRRGLLRVAEVNGTSRIPAEEVERLAREGFDVTRPAKGRRRRTKAVNPGVASPEAIRALRLG